MNLFWKIPKFWPVKFVICWALIGEYIYSAFSCISVTRIIYTIIGSLKFYNIYIYVMCVCVDMLIIRDHSQPMRDGVHYNVTLSLIGWVHTQNGLWPLHYRRAIDCSEANMVGFAVTYWSDDYFRLEQNCCHFADSIFRIKMYVLW